MIHIPLLLTGALKTIGTYIPSRSDGQMKKYDRYHQQLSPGDLIVWSDQAHIYSGKIHSITPAGTLRVFERNSFGQYSSKPRTVLTHRVVKVESFADGKNYATDNCQNDNH